MLVVKFIAWITVSMTSIQLCSACAATSSASSPTTTPASASATTTTTTTTTAAPSACTSCTIGQITFTPMNGAGTESSTYSGPTSDSSGCLQLTAICAASSTGPVFMQFNTDEGGPSEPTGTDVTAVLNCVNGNWVYAPSGQESRIITEVNCVAA